MGRVLRLLVCGGRDYQDRERLYAELDRIGPATIIQGGASGADRLARLWCVDRLVPYYHYPADWKAHGKAAGPIRNQHMIDDGKPDLVIAFPGGRGTADMIRRAEQAGVPVKRIPA